MLAARVRLGRVPSASSGALAAPERVELVEHASTWRETEEPERALAAAD